MLKNLSFFALCITCLVVANSSLAADTAASSPNNQLSPTDSTKQELLMYFDEKDLVTATKRATPLRKAPAIATIVSAEEIRNMGARNLLDVIKMTPGFGISFTEDGVTMIEMRGIRTSLSEKILIMIDGHSMNRNAMGSAIWALTERIPVEHIKQVEIVRSPGSSLYGNSAFLATINVITKNADDVNGTEIKAGGGNFDSYHGNILVGKSFGEKVSVMGSTDYVNTRGPKLNVPQDALGNSGSPDLGFWQTDTFLKLGNGDFSIRGGFRKVYKEEYIGLGYAIAHTGEQNINTYWTEAAYALRFSNTLTTNFKVHYDHWEQNPLVKILPDSTPGFPQGMIGKPMMKDRSIGGELQLDWDLFDGNHLIFGTSYEVMQQYDTKQYANFNPLTFTPIGSVQEVANFNKDATRQIFALYLQDEWQLLNNIYLTAGVRYDHYSDFGDTVNPRAGLVWNFLENADLKLLYGSAFRAPTFTELYNRNNPVTVGNPHLKPEKITTYEAATTYRFARWLAFDINYFYSNITDLIDWDRSTIPGVMANIGKAKTQGVEVGLHGSVPIGLSWKASYTYQDSRDDITGNRLPYVPSQRLNGSVNYAFNRYLNLHTDVLWTGERRRAVGETRPSMPSYTTVDLAITAKNLIQNLELQVSIHNLFDERFKDPDTSGALNQVPGDFPREGISWFLTAMYRF